SLAFSRCLGRARCSLKDPCCTACTVLGRAPAGAERNGRVPGAIPAFSVPFERPRLSLPPTDRNTRRKKGRKPISLRDLVASFSVSYSQRILLTVPLATAGPSQCNTIFPPSRFGPPLEET